MTGLSGGTAIVKNLDLHDVHVENNTEQSGINQALLSLVTSNLGKVLGGLVDVLLTVLSFDSANTDLGTTLSNLLNARANDPTIFATGAFAGRVYGDAVVEDCCVTGTVEVGNVKDRTGGFVGYTEGFTEYSGLSQTLGTVAGALSSILNAIPSIGLGDLITILLGNALPVNQLIPTGYIAPTISDCYVEGLTGNVGTTAKDYAGGFVGQQIGTRIEDCDVRNSAYTVQAKNFGGCFNGCSSLTDLSFVSQGALLNAYAFNATGAQSVVLSDSLLAIPNYAFTNCPALTTVTIPESVVLIQPYAFDRERVTIRCMPDSYAHIFAQENSVAYEFVPTYLLGDADGDGVIQLLDATIIQRRLAGIAVTDPDVVERNGDIEGEGLGISDATWIQRRIAQMEIPYEVGKTVAIYHE